jgi:hypothetical protein
MRIALLTRSTVWGRTPTMLLELVDAGCGAYGRVMNAYKTAQRFTRTIESRAKRFDSGH